MRNFLIKEDVDKVIELTKEFRVSYSVGAWNKKNKAGEKAFGENNFWVSHIITGITCSQKDQNPSNELYYRVLECFDFVIIERTKVFDFVEKGGKE